MKKVYKEIFISEAVYHELEKGKYKYYRNISNESWIKIVKVKNKSLIKQLEKDLDKGVAEAIALSIEISANLLLIDGKTWKKKKSSRKRH
ncbi:MAG: hypothetical protein Q9M89_08265 [Persephonella sp.]|nr:hypothetical protein [Persephonella sp.]